MKKIVFTSLVTFGLLANVAFAATLDTKQAKTEWTAYKTMDKVAVSGTFNDIKYHFGKDASSIKGLLEGASATITPANVELKDALKNKNVRESFFAKFAKKEDIKVTFKSVIEGNNKGTILASVRMNGKYAKVPMQYEIKNGMLEAKGILDLADFNALDALKSLTQAVRGLHSNLTWTQVEISFSAPVK